ncbi:Cell cycle checkpoint control protein RAD9A [Schistosoma japonicum]|nr:Cell cycle checkpoint control protein RAD9A [Schistosoma japonicum]
MDVILQPTELKVLVRAINCLGKLGHEVYFECGSNDLKIKTVNSSRSAYALVHFREVFFDKFSNTSNRSLQRFKIPSSSCSNVFRLNSALERSVLKCKMFLSTKETTLTVQYFFKFGIVKTYNMSIIDCEQLEAVYSLEESANHLVLSVRLLEEVISNFRQSFEELTLLLDSGECTFQNHTFVTDPSMITTQIPLNAAEFDAYKVQSKCQVTFCQKELRVVLSFCELISPMVRIYCDRPGKPIIFACTHETRLSARYVFATFPTDGSTIQNSQHSEYSRRLFPSRTPVLLQHSSTSSRKENFRNDDTVLGNKESYPNIVLSKRCSLSQLNEPDTQILPLDRSMTFLNDQNSILKVKQPVSNPYQGHEHFDEIPTKKVHCTFNKYINPEFAFLVKSQLYFP